MHHTPSPSRKAAYGRIHQLAKRLELPDDAYRLTLRALTGKTSCKDLDDGELEYVELSLRVLVGERTPQPACSDAEALAILAA